MLLTRHLRAEWILLMIVTTIVACNRRTSGSGLSDTMASPFTSKETVVLDGSKLTMEQVVKVAHEGALVQITSEAAKRLEVSNAALLKAAKAGVTIYGLSVGVGLNKDKVNFNGAVLSDETRAASEKFNIELLRAHATGSGDYLSEEAIRATMLARLNTMLVGRTGVQPAIPQMLAAFLNKRIHPVAESHGSTGEADIVILPRVGLAMAGEGDVLFNGARISAADALKQAGLQAVKPYAKDGLSIISSNAYSSGMGALMLAHIKQLIDNSTLIFALSLEALDGNIAPFKPEVQQLRPYSGQQQLAKAILADLDGSYLWQPDDKRALQDPLSFRTYSQVTGTVLDSLNFAVQQLQIQLNSSDDNPAVMFEENDPQKIIMPTANFNPMPWVNAMQSLASAVVHVSENSCFRSIKLSDDHFTHLARFLSPDDQTQGFEILQNTITSLQAEVEALSQPVSSSVIPVAGDIEDTATNAPLVVKRLDQQVSMIQQIIGIELLHAAQAVDLRRRDKPNLALGVTTTKVLKNVRQKVPFFNKSRILADDIRTINTVVSQPLLGN